MSIHVTLLRGINVGGHAIVAMSDLRDLFADLGFSDAKSLLQSGNLVFDGGRKTGPSLERLLEAETNMRLNKSIVYLVRTAAEWNSTISRNPFPDEAQCDPSHLVVMFLKQAPTVESIKILEAATRRPELVRLAGKELYIVYPDGIGRSKLTNALIEKSLVTHGTGRNWNTILKLAALIQD